MGALLASIHRQTARLLRQLGYVTSPLHTSVNVLVLFHVPARSCAALNCSEIRLWDPNVLFSRLIFVSASTIAGELYHAH